MPTIFLTRAHQNTFQNYFQTNADTMHEHRW